MGEARDDRGCRRHRGVTRRGFITSVGAGAVAVAAVGRATAEPAAATTNAREMVPCTLMVNGRRHKVLVEPRWSLLYVLRDGLGLTGTKPGCERGECGACTVLLDDRPRYACMTLALEAQGHEITTLEGLMHGEELGPTQRAFLENDALQCGYCTPGQIMAVEGLLRANPDPSLEEIRRGTSGNLCRCGAYVQIQKATSRAAELKKAAGR
jgi:xanthine dehydrogenase YagT iron-sulfur-binding subunit